MAASIAKLSRPAAALISAGLKLPSASTKSASFLLTPFAVAESPVLVAAVVRAKKPALSKLKFGCSLAAKSG